MDNTPSPCVDICSVDKVGKFCTGCGRTLNEIANWGMASEAEKRAIVAQLPTRLTQLKA